MCLRCIKTNLHKYSLLKAEKVDISYMKRSIAHSVVSENLLLHTVRPYSATSTCLNSVEQASRKTLWLSEYL